MKLFALLLVALACLAADAPFASRNQRYQLRPGDSVRVAYRVTPEYDATVDVQPDGFATFPLLGDVKLAGQTIPEVRQTLLAKASDRLNNPEMTVELKGFEQPFIIVGGEVGTPGRVPVRGRLTALRAIEIAGGFKTSAKASQVLLIRPVNDVDAQTKLIDLKKVIDKRQLNEDIELRAGDMLVVPKTRLAKVEPYVKLVNAGFYLNPFGF